MESTIDGLDAIFKAEYPDDILKDLIHFMPKNLEDDMTLISSSIDWIGINYYGNNSSRRCKRALAIYKEIKGSLQQTQMGWEIYPDGLKNSLVRVSRVCRSFQC